MVFKKQHQQNNTFAQELPKYPNDKKLKTKNLLRFFFLIAMATTANIKNGMEKRKNPCHGIVKAKKCHSKENKKPVMV